MARRKKIEKKDPYEPSEAHRAMVLRNQEYVDQLRANMNRWIAHRDRVWLGKATPIEYPEQTTIEATEEDFEHHCHAHGCKAHCPPEHLMCWHHWRMVPKDMQNAVWKAYRPGQCQDKQVSAEWENAANMAILFVKAAEDSNARQAQEDAALARCRERLHRAIPEAIRTEAARLAAEYNAKFPINEKGSRDNTPPMEKHPPVHITPRRETPF